jgi:hypothetical protein
MIAGKLYDVGVGPHGHITGEGEFRNENAESDLGRVYERGGSSRELRPRILHLATV